MLRYVYNSIYMIRMLKDKVYDTLINYYYNKHMNKVKRMNPSHSLITDIYNLSSGIDHIQDYIYIGNAYGASNYYLLNENNIGLKINSRDQNCESLFENLEETLSKIYDYHTTHPEKNILIHCYMGSSRSATIISAYLIKYYNFTVSQSIQLLKKQRDIVNINNSFIEDLRQFYNINNTVNHTVNESDSDSNNYIEL